MTNACTWATAHSLSFWVRNRRKRSRMSTIEEVALSGGSAKLGVYTRDHCPPHATCRETTGQWVVRISFSFADPTAVGLLSAIPSKSIPGHRVINELINAVQRNLQECRRLWWTYRQNNPSAHTEGACCLNNTGYGSRIVRDATYDSRTCRTRLRFTDGQTLLLPM
jgi:hypothetical protein